MPLPTVTELDWSQFDIAVGDKAAFITKFNAYLAGLQTSVAEQNALLQSVFEWANNGSGVAVSVAAGGDGVSDFSALHWAAVAQSFSGFPTMTGHAGEFLTTDGGTTSWGNVLSWGAPKTANWNMAGSEQKNADISSGSITATLPATLVAGEVFVVHVYGSDANQFTIARNGHTITREGVNIDTAGDGNLVLENGDTVKLVATSASTVEIV